jgi:hypothetical protein
VTGISLLDVCARLERETGWAGSVDSLRGLATAQLPPLTVWEDPDWGWRLSEVHAALLYDVVTAGVRAGEQQMARIHATPEPRGMMHAATYTDLPGQAVPERPEVGVARRIDP